MAKIVLTVPDEVIAAIDLLYGGSVKGMTDQAKVAHHLRTSLLASLQAVKRQTMVTPAVATEVRARIAAESALAVEATARKAAETEADAAAVALLDKVI